ncbi:MAG: hypothetical protein QOG96_2511, partial [Pseudonocardiales bacterium]|nr:hypothetical protein [Pseudonocardiales bacterium]
ALAAESNDGSEPKPPSSAAAQRPGQSLSSKDDDQNGDQNSGGDQSSGGDKPAEPPKEPDPPKPSKPADPPTVIAPAPPAQQLKPIPADPKASLSLSPNVAKQGTNFAANASCANGKIDSLSGDGVSFSGTTGSVGDNARPGNHTVTLVCVNASKRDTATATLQVVKPNDPGGPGLHPSILVDPKVVKPGDEINFNGGCPNGRQESLTADGVDVRGNSGRVRDDAREGGHTATRTCVEGDRRESASDTFRVTGKGGPVGGNTLSVSPKLVRQGGTVYFNGDCGAGRQISLSADDVEVRGRAGTVRDDARLGDHTATRECAYGGGAVTATHDNFRVVPGDNNGNGDGPRDFWLSDRSGYRGDSVDVSVRCRDNSARLDSDALDDITLHRDGGRLRGSTRVVGHVGNGWHRVTVSCDGHSESRGFLVLSDRGDHDRYLSVDPGYGHRGDEVDIHVGCDWSVGRVESNALDDIDVDHDGRPWRYSGTTHVSDDAEPGEHTVRVRCGNDTLEESFFVKGDHDGDHDGDNGSDGDDSTPDGGEQTSVYPLGAPETGGGPVGGGSPGLVALGVIGATGATIAGAGTALVRRGARR